MTQLKKNDNSTVNEKSLEDSFTVKNFGSISAGLDIANSLTTSILGEKSEYSGTKGDLAKTIDGAYDKISDLAGNFGPIGKLVSLGMKAGKLTTDVLNKLGSGTDGMTVTDALMANPILQLSGIGLINGFGGKRADTIVKDDELFETMGTSYSGTSSAIDDALIKSGKKYGAFSSGARNKANSEIELANKQQKIVSDISDEANDRFALKNSMSAINSNRRDFAMKGGWDQYSVRMGRNGLSIHSVLAAKRVVSAFKFQQGGKSNDPFDIYLQSLPKEQRDSTDFRVKDYWEFNGKPKNFEEAISKGMFTLQPDGWYANSVAENPLTGEIEFMKSSAHPSHYMEVDWYNSDDATEFRNQYELQKTEPYWKYVKRKQQGDAVNSFQQGGILELTLQDIPEEYLEPMSTIEEVTLDSILPKFKEGGKVNVIPEGALHARLHHMDNADNLTKKGIPVVSEKEGGELEQQAEIEREEVILRLEVTQQLENLKKKYESSEYSQKEKDQFAIEAGKILTYELLENTVDNTGLLNNIN